MVKVRVLGIALDSAGQHIVLLKPIDDVNVETAAANAADRVLPVWIGQQEATSILVAIEGEEMPRPLTHDLVTTLFTSVGSTIDHVHLTRITEGTFYAELTITTPVGVRVLDSRPSDAIALAVRAEAPIFVADEVLAEAGIPAEMVDLDGDDEQLEEFKRFLDDVDPDDFRG